MSVSKRSIILFCQENESLKDEVLKAQHRLVKVSRDQRFLMDRLMQYEAPAPHDSSSSSSSGEETEDSDGDVGKDEPLSSSAKKYVQMKFFLPFFQCGVLYCKFTNL
jgi:hypothetical protein